MISYDILQALNSAKFLSGGISLITIEINFGSSL